MTVLLRLVVLGGLGGGKRWKLENGYSWSLARERAWVDWSSRSPAIVIDG